MHDLSITECRVGTTAVWNFEIFHSYIAFTSLALADSQTESARGETLASSTPARGGDCSRSLEQCCNSGAQFPTLSEECSADH